MLVHIGLGELLISLAHQIGGIGGIIIYEQEPKQLETAFFLYEPLVRKPVFGVSDQVRCKPGCTATEDGQKLEILDLESREIVLSM